jgi:hypothetical protein
MVHKRFASGLLSRRVMKAVRGVLVILIMTEVYLIKDVAAPAEIPVLTGSARQIYYQEYIYRKLNFFAECAHSVAGFTIQGSPGLLINDLLTR